ncbi:glycoside hydrolase family 130 protein [Sphingomonas mucosissima]|uniref:Beta-1,4-mannooligosaccharide phosphorylase n=1 Tax=Sphingomonas mucosissima TaxID=370959 RepID=A0A245ZLC0_9SPHN|nr:glycoside hydrolase family 130 protein [Sphingomonas mucosissima]OWK30542.1 beta-1,4-mannooligosaccharide phosphorylase [Sphingomonas mucosissima]
MNAADVFRTLPIELKPDPSRTVIRPFSFGYPEPFGKDRPTRMQQVADRLLSLDTAMRERMRRLIEVPMHERHPNADATFLRRFDDVAKDLQLPADLSETDRLLLGAYFSQEYAFEAAALFNPSIIPMPGAENTDGSIAFLLSLRGIGEGHVSSVTFRTGTWDGHDQVVVHPASEQGVPPRIEAKNGEWIRLLCDESDDVSETVLFPVLPSQRSGIEDLRLVQFAEEDGSHSVIGTYTAFDGVNARQEMLRGVDLRTVEMRALTGAMAPYKGMALFPRKIAGQFVMLGRQDNENIWLLRSDRLEHWDTGERILGPKYPWEFVQMGNCGSPTEIDEGWLVFTHGVGLVRGYCVGACLLNKEDPSKVLARTPSPLLFPSAEQRGGYVPNVTYSCGALVHGRRILLPYAIGDEFSAFAVGNVDDLLSVIAPA